METIKIAGKNYPLHYNMATFRHILTDLKTDLQGLADKAGSANMAEVFEFMLVVAFYGMKTGNLKDSSDKALPFKSVDDLANSIDKLEELTPAINVYTKAWNEFLGIKPEAEEGNEPQPEAEAPAKKAKS